MAVEVLEYRILNWEKYNPRSDGKSHSWFRVESAVVASPLFTDAPPSAVKLWLWLLCHAAARRGHGRRTMAAARRELRVSGRTLANDLHLLQHLEFIAIEKSQLRVVGALRTNERTNETNETNVSRGGHETASCVTTTKPKRVSTKAPKPKTDGARVWDAYAVAYASRYGHEPLRNAKQSALCTQLVQRLGADIAPEVIKFYCRHSAAFYSQSLHPLTLALRDAEKLYTEWKAGVQMTAAMSREAELLQNNRQVIEAVFGRAEDVPS